MQNPTNAEYPRDPNAKEFHTDENYIQQLLVEIQNLQARVHDLEVDLANYQRQENTGKELLLEQKTEINW